MSLVTPPEIERNLRAFSSPQAVAEFSVYHLFPEEERLFQKYYRPGETVLDLACGLGRTTLLLHEMGLSVRGVDFSQIFIDTAKRRLPYLDLRVGSFHQLEEADNSFSHVLISFNGIDYAFPEQQRVTALRESVRVLRPGGTLIYSSHNLKSMHFFSPYYSRRLQWKLRNCHKAWRDWAYIMEDGVHAFYASSSYVVRQSQALGLQLEEMNGFGRLGHGPLDLYFSPYIHYVFRKA